MHAPAALLCLLLLATPPVWQPRAAVSIDSLKTAPRLCATPDSGRHYLLSLPDAWTPGGTWPTAVIFQGSNANFRTIAATWHRISRGLPFIVITPLIVSNAGNYLRKKAHYAPYDDSALIAFERWDFQKKLACDLDGVHAVRDDVHRRYGGEHKAYLCGFSAGGNLMWECVFRDSRGVHVAAPVCASYYGGARLDSARADRSLPVVCWQGKKDPHGKHMLQSWQSAESQLKKHGYRHLRFIGTMRGHDWHHDEVIALFLAHYQGRAR
jgi:dienelactone hydrolase